MLGLIMGNPSNLLRKILPKITFNKQQRKRDQSEGSITYTTKFTKHLISMYLKAKSE